MLSEEEKSWTSQLPQPSAKLKIIRFHFLVKPLKSKVKNSFCDLAYFLSGICKWKILVSDSVKWNCKIVRGKKTMQSGPANVFFKWSNFYWLQLQSTQGHWHTLKDITLGGCLDQRWGWMISVNLYLKKSSTSQQDSAESHVVVENGKGVLLRFTERKSWLFVCLAWNVEQSYDGFL